MVIGPDLHGLRDGSVPALSAVGSPHHLSFTPSHHNGDDEDVNGVEFLNGGMLAARPISSVGTPAAFADDDIAAVSGDVRNHLEFDRINMDPDVEIDIYHVKSLLA